MKKRESLEAATHTDIFNGKVNKGITLVALVITIVVLIILATVAIQLSLGNNGIFNRAKTAKQQYQNATQYEDTQVGKISNQIDDYSYGIGDYLDGDRSSTSITCLYKKSETGNSFELSENYSNYNLLLFLHTDQSSGNAIRTSIFPTEYLKLIKQNNLQFSIDGYGEHAANLKFENDKKIYVDSYAAGNEYVFAIYGIK